MTSQSSHASSQSTWKLALNIKTHFTVDYIPTQPASPLTSVLKLYKLQIFQFKFSFAHYLYHTLNPSIIESNATAPHVAFPLALDINTDSFDSAFFIVSLLLDHYYTPFCCTLFFYIHFLPFPSFRSFYSKVCYECKQ